MQKTITIVVMHSYTLIRKAIRKNLDGEPDLLVIGEADTREQALQIVSAYRPLVMLHESISPCRQVFPVLQAFKQASPETQIVLIETQNQETTLLSALRAGARSYVTLDLKREELTEVVRKAARGETLLTSSIATHLVCQLQELPSEGLSQLNEREEEILFLVAHAYSNAEIARKLFLSEKTVKNYVSSLLNKLSMADRTQLAVYAWQQGLISSTHDTEPLQIIRTEAN